MILSKSIIYAQFPPLNISDSIQKKEKPIKYNEVLNRILEIEESNFLFGFNVSKMTFRPLTGGFSIDLEALHFFNKKRKWAVGGEFGYTEYYWKLTDRNFSVHNKGFYMKPSICYLILSDLYLSLSMPLGFFEESGEVQINNFYYINNPNKVTYYRPNQLFVGLEASISHRARLDNNFYLNPGIRFAPLIYRPNIADDLPMNTRYFPGLGYNLNHQDTYKNNSPWHSALGLFIKIQTFF